MSGTAHNDSVTRDHHQAAEPIARLTVGRDQPAGRQAGARGFRVEVDSEAFEQLRLLGLELFRREKTLIA